MDKLKMHSPDMTQQNIKKIQALFPNCVTESKGTDGELQLAIDFDQLKQELSNSIVEGPQERYQLNWPGKRASIFSSNAPIAKTLRPDMNDSLSFDITKNLFIEGDNLDVIKLLQESYLNKVGVIYIDPPYNTGKDFLYDDDFSESYEDYIINSNQKNNLNERLVSNLESNGRFHSDWLTRMYSRLKLSRNLLDDHGVIFVSINDREVHNLRKILDEIFGAENFIASLIWDKNHSAQAGIFKVYHEYILVYAKDINFVDTPQSTGGELFEAGAMKRESSRHPSSEFKFPAGVRFNAPEGTELVGKWGGIESVELVSGRMVCENGVTKYDVTLKASYTQKNQMQQYFYGDRDSLVDSRGQKISEFYFTSSGKVKIVKVRGVDTPQSTLKDYGTQGSISTDLAALFGMDQTPLDNPKPVNMIKDFIRWFSYKDDVIIDYFAGSGTTAHSVLQLNSEDGGNRKFVLVQLPVHCSESSPAFDAGYSMISEITKERIRRSGAKILEGECHKDWNKDVGFRVLRVDTSNMADVYYSPDQVSQGSLDLLVDNIKADRTDEDLLFQVLLDWGVDLTLPIRKETIQGKSVFFVDDDALAACFDLRINEALIKELAAKEPLRVVFRDDGFESDAVKINAEQIFKQVSPHTEVKAI